MVDRVIQEMLDRMASSMANLMANDPDWRDQAYEIRDELEQADINAMPEGETPKERCRSLFETPGMARLAEKMLQRRMVPENMDRALYIIQYVLPGLYLGTNSDRFVDLGPIPKALTARTRPIGNCRRRQSARCLLTFGADGPTIILIESFI
jgi:hypothetical protein